MVNAQKTVYNKYGIGAQCSYTENLIGKGDNGIFKQHSAKGIALCIQAEFQYEPQGRRKVEYIHYVAIEKQCSAALN